MSDHSTGAIWLVVVIGGVGLIAGVVVSAIVRAVP